MKASQTRWLEKRLGKVLDDLEAIERYAREIPYGDADVFYGRISAAADVVAGTVVPGSEYDGFERKR